MIKTSEENQLMILAAPEKGAENERQVRDGFWPKVRKVAARIPFLPELLTSYYAAMDPATPKRAKLIMFAALAYFVMPVDAVPDILAAVGFTDDAALFWAAWKTIRSHVTPEHEAKAADMIDRLKDTP